MGGGVSFWIMVFSGCIRRSGIRLIFSVMGRLFNSPWGHKESDTTERLPHTLVCEDMYTTVILHICPCKRHCPQVSSVPNSSHSSPSSSPLWPQPLSSASCWCSFNAIPRSCFSQVARWFRLPFPHQRVAFRDPWDVIQMSYHDLQGPV